MKFCLPLIFLLAICYAPAGVHAAELDVWIGTGEPSDATPGIYHLTFNDQTGALSPARLVAERSGAGFLAMHPTLPVLYSTSGGVAAWKIIRDESQSQPRLEFMNETPTGDGRACFISVDRTGRVLLSAQYGGGSVCSYPLAADGRVGEFATKIEHDEPANLYQDRQETCHPHWAGVSRDNQFVVVPDLGADKIFLHRLDSAKATMTKFGSTATPPGGGPRHFKFHPTLPVGYVVNELAMSVSVVDWNHKTGQMKVQQTIPTLSEEQIGGERFNSGSEVRVHPSGKFVYSGNRGHDSITAFAVDQGSGELSLVEQEPIRGSWPRNFNLDPSGRWLLAAGGKSNTLSVFAIDQETGALQFARQIRSVPAPICVLIEAKPTE